MWFPLIFEKNKNVSYIPNSLNKKYKFKINKRKDKTNILKLVVSISFIKKIF